MDQTPSLEAALRRLTAALSRLEDLARLEDLSGVEGANGREPAGGDPAPDAERDRLAAALEASETRVERLEGANRDVARRVDQAVNAIQSVLDEAGRGEG